MPTHRAHITYQVPYADTDRMGVVYYANYLVYFERVRTQLLRDLGLPYRDLEARGYALPVAAAHVTYRAAAGYDDTLDIYGWLAEYSRVRLRVACAVYARGVLLAEGYTEHAFVAIASRRPVRLIPELEAICRAACDPAPAAAGPTPDAAAADAVRRSQS